MHPRTSSFMRGLPTKSAVGCRPVESLRWALVSDLCATLLGAAAMQWASVRQRQADGGESAQEKPGMLRYLRSTG
jgi:hypothetical protein